MIPFLFGVAVGVVLTLGAGYAILRTLPGPQG